MFVLQTKMMTGFSQKNIQQLVYIHIFLKFNHLYIPFCVLGVEVIFQSDLKNFFSYLGKCMGLLYKIFSMYFSTRSGRNQIEQIPISNYFIIVTVLQNHLFFHQTTLHFRYILVLLIGILGVIHRRWGQPRSNMLVKFYVHTYAVLTHLPPPNVCEDACGVNFTKIAGC